MQFLLRSIAPYTLESLFASDGANGFYGFAKEHSPADLLRHFNRARRFAPLHAQANMPGKVMLVYALELLTASPAALAWLVAAVSALGGLLLYVFTRELLGDTRTALFAAILYWFYPARIFFLPIMNTVTPVLVLGCACLFLRWLRTGRTAYPVALGLALYVLVFFEPLPLVIGLLFAALAARAVAAGEISAEPVGRSGVPGRDHLHRGHRGGPCRHRLRPRVGARPDRRACQRFQRVRRASVRLLGRSESRRVLLRPRRVPGVPVRRRRCA